MKHPKVCICLYNLKKENKKEKPIYVIHSAIKDVHTTEYIYINDMICLPSHLLHINMLIRHKNLAHNQRPNLKKKIIPILMHHFICRRHTNHLKILCS